MEKDHTEELQQCINILPIVKKAIFYDLGITLADLEKYLLNIPAENLNIKIPVGSPIKEGSGIYRAIHERRQIFFRADKSQRGVPYIVRSSPIFDKNGELIGAISIAESTERYDNLKQISGSLSVGINELASTSEEISAQSQEILAASQQLGHVMKESVQRVNETNRIIGILNDVTRQTNMIGLNAAIEAARVGEAGRGFGVVAGEIRKLSANNGESLKEVIKIINTIKLDSERSHRQIIQIEASIRQIVDAVIHLSESIQEFNTMALRLDTMAEKINSIS